MSELLQKLRKEYPMYSQVGDDDLFEGYRSRFHPDLSAEQLNDKYTRKLKDEQGIMESGIGGLKRGFTNLKASTVDLIPAMIGDAIGADDYRDRQIAEYQEKMRANQEANPTQFSSYTDVENAGDAFKYAAETIGEFIPSVATSMTGVGLARTIAGKGAKTFLQKRLIDQIGATVGSGFQTIPEAYQNISQQTGDPQLAAGIFITDHGQVRQRRS